MHGNSKNHENNSNSASKEERKLILEKETLKKVELKLKIVMVLNQIRNCSSCLIEPYSYDTSIPRLVSVMMLYFIFSYSNATIIVCAPFEWSAK